MNQTYPLGMRLIVSGYVVQGKFPPREVEFYLGQLVEFVGMTTAGMNAIVRVFPLLTGQGGVGYTIFQPLVESFLVADSWDDHDHVFIILASCKPYSTRDVKEFLERNLGPVIDQGYMDLQGKGGPRDDT